MDIKSIPVSRVRSTSKASSGFTLLELMVTMASTFIMFGLVMPQVTAQIDRSRFSTQINAFSSSLQFARSTAVTQNQQVVICKSPDGLQCNRRAPWQDGWIVFVDADRDRQVSPDEAIIQKQNRLRYDVEIDYRAFGSRNYLTYRPDGITKTNGTFLFCSARHPAQSRALILTKSGRLRISKTRANGDTLNCAINS